MSNFNLNNATAKAIIALLFLGFSSSSNSQTVSTVAGGAGGFVDGTVSKVEFNGTNGVAVDLQGNIYVGDRYNHRIRKISSTGVVSTFAGNGVAGFADGIGTNAEFNQPCGLAIDRQGNIYVAEDFNNRIRKISPLGLVSTLAGNGVRGFADGSGAIAEFSAPDRLAIDSLGNVYVADFLNDRIRKITPGGIVSTLAGNGIAGYADGAAANAEFFRPNGVALDSSGNVYVAEYRNNRVRKISVSGTVSTVAGDGVIGHVDGTAANAEFNGLAGIILDKQGNIYVSDQDGNYLRRISNSGVVSTLAGTGVAGFVDGIATIALLNNPRDIKIDSSGNIYFVDFNTNSVRKVSSLGNVATIAGNGIAGYADGLSANAELYGPNGVAVDAAGNMYVAEYLGNRIRKITPAGVVTTIAGNGVEGYADGPSTTAEFDKLSDIVIDAQGNFFVSEGHGNRIRKITPDGIVSTFAGNGTTGFADGQGTSAEFWQPNRLVFDKQSNLYVADARNNRVRKITPTGLVSTYAGNGISGNVDGVAANAEFKFPNGLAIDSAGNMFVADYSNNTIREIATNGIVTTVAGDGYAGYINGTGTNAEFNQPGGICIDKNGNFYISDESNSRIRKMTAAGVVSLWAGNGVAGLVDGTTDSAEFNDVRALCVDAAGNVYVPDYNNNKIRKITIGSVMPITLINFHVQLEGNDGMITWQTAKENNSDYFNIQRSTNGRDFNNLGKVTLWAAGNSNTVKNYSYTDMNVTSLHDKVLYYRLQEVDKDGAVTLSPIQSIHFQNSSAGFFIAPNPINHFINIFSNADISNAKISVTDMSGKILYVTKENLVAGSQLKIPAVNLAKGTYIVTIETTWVKNHFKIIKD